MALTLYRRHRPECEGGHPEDSKSGEFEEGRRGRKKCACLIHVSGTLGGKFNRKQTGKSSWSDAKTVAAAWEQRNSWEERPAVVTPSELTGLPVRVILIEAVAVFITLREGEKIAPATLRKHKTFTKQLAAFADKRGYVMLDQFTCADIDRFYSGLKLGARAKAKRLGTLRSFFRFCVNRKWLTETPVSNDLKPPQGSSRVANKIPFTDEEMERILG